MLSNENKSKIVEMWQEGISSSIIADRLDVTRNAVIGHVRRCREAGMNLRAGDPDYKVMVFKKKPIKTQGKGGGVQLLSLKTNMCRFPVSTDKEGQHLFCGEPIGHRAYCSKHAAISYVPIRS